LDACALSRGIDVIPAAQKFRSEMAERYPELPFVCPILPGKYYAFNSTKRIGQEEVNLTIDEFKEYKKSMPKTAEDFITSTIFPNGIYRNVIRLFTDEDPIGFAVFWQSERYIRLNDENF
jgi:hypothetical protein